MYPVYLNITEEQYLHGTIYYRTLFVVEVFWGGVWWRMVMVYRTTIVIDCNHLNSTHTADILR